MTGHEFSREERQKLRWAHLLIYVFPALAGLLTVSLVVVADMLHFAQDQFVVIGAFIVNAAVAGLASAYAVSRQHPQEKGKWWRAGTSFLFAFPMTLITAIFFGMCAGCAGILR